MIKMSEIKFKTYEASHFMLFQGEKVQLDVDPNSINTVAVSLEDGSTIYSVAGASEDKKLV